MTTWSQSELDNGFETRLQALTETFIACPAASPDEKAMALLEALAIVLPQCEEDTAFQAYEFMRHSL
jgi:hypothetical protein